MLLVRHATVALDYIVIGKNSERIGKHKDGKMAG